MGASWCVLRHVNLVLELWLSPAWAEYGACAANCGACAAGYNACAAHFGTCAAGYGACAADYGACAAEYGACTAEYSASTTEYVVLAVSVGKAQEYWYGKPDRDRQRERLSAIMEAAEGV